MGKVISLINYKKKNEPYGAVDPERIKRIKESLEKINMLMAELKAKSEVSENDY